MGEENLIEGMKNLRISPSSFWKQGDSKTSKSKLQHLTSGLKYTITYENIIHVGDVLEEFISFLTPIKEELGLLTNVKKTMSIAIYIYEDMPSFLYGVESIQFLSYINAELDQDIYYLEE